MQQARRGFLLETMEDILVTVVGHGLASEDLSASSTIFWASLTIRPRWA